MCGIPTARDRLISHPTKAKDQRVGAQAANKMGRGYTQLTPTA